mmetsp:Transcript_67379/g.166431  ORF Transcript_67379/g.166431 Transcript_67379/m.166431 type:complete len:770 (-) Transcript_67379:255-2564(-)
MRARLPQRPDRVLEQLRLDLAGQEEEQTVHAPAPIELLLVLFAVHAQVADGGDGALEHLRRARRVADDPHQHLDGVGVPRRRLVLDRVGARVGQRGPRLLARARPPRLDHLHERCDTIHAVQLGLIRRAVDARAAQRARRVLLRGIAPRTQQRDKPGDRSLGLLFQRRVVGARFPDRASGELLPHGRARHELLDQERHALVLDELDARHLVVDHGVPQRRRRVLLRVRVPALEQVEHKLDATGCLEEVARLAAVLHGVGDGRRRRLLDARRARADQVDERLHATVFREVAHAHDLGWVCGAIGTRAVARLARFHDVGERVGRVLLHVGVVRLEHAHEGPHARRVDDGHAVVRVAPARSRNGLRGLGLQLGLVHTIQKIDHGRHAARRVERRLVVGVVGAGLEDGARRLHLSRLVALLVEHVDEHVHAARCEEDGGRVEPRGARGVPLRLAHLRRAHGLLQQRLVLRRDPPVRHPAEVAAPRHGVGPKDGRPLPPPPGGEPRLLVLVPDRLLREERRVQRQLRGAVTRRVEPVALLHGLELLHARVGARAVIRVLGPGLLHQLNVARRSRQKVNVIYTWPSRGGLLGLVRLERDLLNNLHYVHALPGDLPRQKLPHHDPHRVDVHAHPLRLALHDLRGHVLRGSRDGLGAWQHRERPEALREAKVPHLDPLIRSHQHVERLEVPVDQPRSVHGPQPVHAVEQIPHPHRPGEAQLVGGEGLVAARVDDLEEGPALHKLKHHPRRRLQHPVAPHDARVVHRRHLTDLDLELL